MIFWKSQSPWPALRGGFYDYYLETTGGFWGVRAAAAEAVHLQLNQDSRTLAVISRKFAPSQHPASATATFLDLRTGAPVGEVVRCKPVVVAPNAVTDLGCEAAWPAGHEGTLLLRLALTINERVVRCAFPETVFFNGPFPFHATTRIRTIVYQDRLRTNTQRKLSTYDCLLHAQLERVLARAAGSCCGGEGLGAISCVEGGGKAGARRCHRHHYRRAGSDHCRNQWRRGCRE